MHLFIVIFRDEVPNIKVGPDSLIQSVFALPENRAFLIESPIPQSAILSNHLFQLDQPQEEQRAGVILKLNGSYSGLHKGELWEWLETHVVEPQ